METNTNNATISIIIPHWENIDGLEILLESIRQEAFKQPNLAETIVVDDYSCPETQQKLRDLQNRFDFHLYFNNSIKSAGTCRNIGIEKSTGQWLLFADSDDYFLPGFLDATKKYLSSDYDIVFFPPTSADYNNHNILSNRHFTHSQLVKNYPQNSTDIKYRWYTAWSRLIKKRIITNNGIKFDSVIAYNDVLFSTHLGFHSKKITVDTNTIYTITQRQSSLTYNTTLQHWLSRIEVYIRNNRFLERHKLVEYKKVYWRWLLPILAYFGISGFLKAIFLILSKHENPLPGLADEIARYLSVIKKGKYTFKMLIIKILQKRNYIQ